MTPTVEDAQDDIEEANASLGAALSTSSLPYEIETLLLEVQHELLDLAEAIGGRGPVPSDDRLRRALDRYGGPGVPTAEFSVLGGANLAAGLLKLARVVTRRAARTVSSLAGPPEHAEGYLRHLMRVLLVVAFHAEELERELVPWGSCVDLG
jgi:cob(I)alamin adenosyltransferase